MESDPPRLDDNARQRWVDARNVTRVAGDNGVMALPGAEHDVDINDVTVPGVRAHKPDCPGYGQRHDGEVDVGRFEQPGQADLARGAPRLSDRFGRDAYAATAPPGLIQACLHDNSLAGVIERE